MVKLKAIKYSSLCARRLSAMRGYDRFRFCGPQFISSPEWMATHLVNRLLAEYTDHFHFITMYYLILYLAYNLQTDQGHGSNLRPR